MIDIGDEHCMCAPVCVCVCVPACECVHVYLCMRVCMCVYVTEMVYMYAYMCVHVCVCFCVCVCVCVCVRTSERRQVSPSLTVCVPWRHHHNLSSGRDNITTTNKGNLEGLFELQRNGPPWRSEVRG
ncbi:unnamed protein product [Arctogadus glacialis]